MRFAKMAARAGRWLAASLLLAVVACSGTDATIGSGSDDGGATDGAFGDASGNDGSSDGSTGSDGSTSDASAMDASASDGGSDAIADAIADARDGACDGGGVEDCFNGVDDDCNGLADCADPACQPVAECVPEAQGFSYGAEVAQGAACPARFVAPALDLEQGLNAPTTCTGCGCTSTLWCTNIVTEGAAGTCPPFSPVNATDVSSLTCQAISINTTNASTQGTVTHTSCGFSGSPAPDSLAWASRTKFCATSSVGAGCAAGNVCVAKATKHCVATPGVFACSAGYSTEGAGGPWYTGVTDTRSCGSTCGCTKSGGSCGSALVVLYAAAGCGAGVTTDISDNQTACHIPVGLFQSATVAVPPNAVQPTCSPSYAAMTGGATATGAETLCCR